MGAPDSNLRWTLDGDTVIRPFETDDVTPLWHLIAANRTHLDRWLRWSSAVRSPGDVQELITRFAALAERGEGFHSGIWHRGALAGGVVVWYIHRQNRNSEIGYWLGTDFLGRGLATRAARAATDYLLGQQGLHRVEMQCGVENSASRAVPQRLGFTLEGIRRQSHWITDRFVDHAVYGMLAGEWPAS
jgi:ribosomal-protein-serine acetyltransferase